MENRRWQQEGGRALSSKAVSRLAVFLRLPFCRASRSTGRTCRWSTRVQPSKIFLAPRLRENLDFNVGTVPKFNEVFKSSRVTKTLKVPDDTSRSLGPCGSEPQVSNVNLCSGPPNPKTTPVGSPSGKSAARMGSRELLVHTIMSSFVLCTVPRDHSLKNDPAPHCQSMQYISCGSMKSFVEGAPSFATSCLFSFFFPSH